MRNIICLLAFCSGIHAVEAQHSRKIWQQHRRNIEMSRQQRRAVLSLDTVFYVGVPHCINIAHEQGGYAQNSEFFTLYGASAFYARQLPQHPDIYELTFTENAHRGYLRVNAPLNLWDAVVEARFFLHGALDPLAVRQFLIEYGEEAPPTEGIPSGDQYDRWKKRQNQDRNEEHHRREGRDRDYRHNREHHNQPPLHIPPTPLPPRNYKMPVEVRWEEIKQDGVLIGKITKRFGTKEERYDIFNPLGEKVAEALGKMHSNHWTVYLLPAYEEHPVRCETFKEKEAISTLLVQLRRL